MTCKPQLMSKFLSGLTIALGGGAGFVAINLYKGNEKFYNSFVMPVLHATFDGESAHRLAINMAKYSLLPDFYSKMKDYKNLKSSLWTLEFNHPIGLAAGFDKDGEAVPGLSKLGFSFIEVGSVTPNPQSGNEKPRVFRLKNDEAIINRYGFNSAGHEAVRENLTKSLSNLKPTVVGLNLGKNKASVDSVDDYVAGLEAFGNSKFIDYFVINISSPNTPGLRNIQLKNHLEPFLDKILQTKAKLKITKPLLLKISPDLSEKEKEDIAELVIKSRPNGLKIDGLVVTNTTVSRPDLKSPEASETGGLSGQPLKNLSTQMIRDMHFLTKGSIPIIGAGGVSDGKDAYEKLRAGASLIQLYTALTYRGPSLVSTIVDELSHLISEDGFSSIEEIIGIDAEKATK
ncbi:dihydroorotate dehydrogenase (quinone), mitochondrial [Tetranychus urticae]|uniref:Dihydroorotate dehydrogenase (quinone), mitochondrial n=1 Tax=Tetranychus urticae TaxID=32264 RepID=T1KZU8_TETUR|nr:dihydroorotate dehydrogenase (quinone), mitochondrial [Tetranychus urticae]